MLMGRVGVVCLRKLRIGLAFGLVPGVLAAALAAFGGLAFEAQAAAQGSRPATTLTEPPAPLLPTNAQLAAPANASAIPDDSPELLAVLQEDGLKRQDSRSLMTAVKAGAAPVGWVKAYEFTDATDAFAAYTYLRMGGQPARHGVNATEFEKPGELVFLSGTSVVRAKANLYPESEAALLGGIEAGLPKVGGRRGLAPLLPTLFPAGGFDASTVRYALGPLGYAAMGGKLPAADLGWDKSAEVATAGYYGGRGTLTLLLYPTPQIAGDRGRVLQNDVNAEGPAKFGTIKMRRLGPLVGITMGGFSDSQAIDLVSALKLNDVVTFDKKMPLEFHAEVRKTYTLLQEISTFSGIGILASIVLAIFFGAARAGIRVLQGKPAASEPEFLSINLRGKPEKPIASDQKADG